MIKQGAEQTGRGLGVLWPRCQPLQDGKEVVAGWPHVCHTRTGMHIPDVFQKIPKVHVEI